MYAETRSTKDLKRAYQLIGGDGDKAVEQGLANALWYRCALSRPQMKSLMQRQDARALGDTLIWFSLIAASGALAWLSWGTLWAIPAFFLYGTLYAGPADSRWHETGHGTAFKSARLNNILYQIASFLVLRRPTQKRWSHARHHTDTLVVGRDPEIVAPRPPDVLGLLLNCLNLKTGLNELNQVLLNAAGKISAEEQSYIPASEHGKVVLEARVWCAIYGAVLAACAATGSAKPLLFIGLPSFYGAWLSLFFGLTQHSGLPENVLDHRLNCRTIYMNPVFRFLYWNMNYHTEHHMFPMVPFHALPQLHALIKDQCPAPYPSTVAAYRELVPAVLRQVREPEYAVRRTLPAGAQFDPVVLPRSSTA
jgi:fatty acid desaturase